MLEYKNFIIGPLDNNCVVLFDNETKEGVIVDPSFDADPVAEFIQQKGLKVSTVFLTHGHFDHYYGLPSLQSQLPELKHVLLHSADLELWNAGGSAQVFLSTVLHLPQPDRLLQDEEILYLGNYVIRVLHTPGHTPGSVVFYIPEIATAFCGDLIFCHGVGRTDMPGSNYRQLKDSIQNKIFTLPPQTTLISGHGPATSVAEEVENNPFFH